VRAAAALHGVPSLARASSPPPPTHAHFRAAPRLHRHSKVDGCGDNSYYPQGYKAMGAALEATGRDIVYSCSWPAYIGSDESVKPFGTFIMDGCNLWRNWDDIQCDWGSLSSIIDHWGDWGSVLAPW
jgi:hypothetical protein